MSHIVVRQCGYNHRREKSNRNICPIHQIQRLLWLLYYCRICRAIWNVTYERVESGSKIKILKSIVPLLIHALLIRSRFPRERLDDISWNDGSCSRYFATLRDDKSPIIVLDKLQFSDVSTHVSRDWPASSLRGEGASLARKFIDNHFKSRNGRYFISGNETKPVTSQRLSGPDVNLSPAIRHDVRAFQSRNAG